MALEGLKSLVLPFTIDHPWSATGYPRDYFSRPAWTLHHISACKYAVLYLHSHTPAISPDFLTYVWLLVGTPGEVTCRSGTSSSDTMSLNLKLDSGLMSPGTGAQHQKREEFVSQTKAREVMVNKLGDVYHRVPSRVDHRFC